MEVAYSISCSSPGAQASERLKSLLRTWWLPGSDRADRPGDGGPGRGWALAGGDRVRGAGAAGGDGETAREAVRQQFGAVAANYVTSAVHARGADLQDLVQAAAPTGDERVLDLGAAAGHAALALAPHVRSVTGVDITP